MAKTKFNYGWVIKWILAAIIIAAGVLTKIYEQNIVYATTGLAVIIFSIFRVGPLLKTLKKETLRTMNLIEIIFEFIIGVIMGYVGFFLGNPVPAFWVTMYGYMLTFFLLARGVVYFVSLYYFAEKTEPAKFWTHLLFVALGPVILTLTILGKDIISTLGWLLLIASLGGAVFLGFDGLGGYKKYREKSKALNTEKQKTKEPMVEKELPKPLQDEVEEKETYIS
jgi:peroxiredoxin family protein